MRAALIAHSNDCDPGFVGVALRARGYSFHEYMREDSATWGPQIDQIVTHHDLVLSLGSSWSTYWPEVAEHVAAEAQLLREAHHRGVRVLGICFGAQMLSTALGGSVDKAPLPEVGWHPISAQIPSGQGGDEKSAHVHNHVSPRVQVPAEVYGAPWMQWHYDTFSVPDGFQMLGFSAAGPQIMWAERSVGLQFHPEATESIVARWSEGEGADELERLGIDATELAERTRVEVPNAVGRCDALVEWFLAVTA